MVLSIVEIDDSPPDAGASVPVAGLAAAPPGWAAGLRVLVAPLASASAARRVIWRRQLVEAGGEPVTQPACATHLVVADEVDEARLEHWLSTQGPFGAQQPLRVSTEWLVQSILSQCCKDEAAYRWPVLERRVRRRELGATSSDVSTHSIVKGQGNQLRSRDQRPHSETLDPIAMEASGKKPEGRHHTALPAVTTAPDVFRTSLAKPSPADRKRPAEDGEAFGGATTPAQERVLRMRRKFACQREPNAVAGLKNALLVEAFGKLLKHYEMMGDQWRERNCRTAMNVLRALPFDLTDASQLDEPQLRRLGRKTRDKIEEFLCTGSIGRVESLGEDRIAAALGELQDIWGVGLHTARQWHARGCRTIQDVRGRATELGLNADQAVGVKYFEEFRQRMPRSEAAAIVERVREVAAAFFGSRLRLEACGSFRRGKETCGDVDVLCCAEEGLELGERDILLKLIHELGGFLTHHLKSSRYHTPGSEHSGATYFGVCQLNPESLHRRIDIKVYPRAEWPFALLSFTGSGPFNRSMRLYARKAGFTLSDHNIRPANHERGVGRGAKIWSGQAITSVEFRQERDIFDFLGLAYRAPHEREIDAKWLAKEALPTSGATCSFAEPKLEVDAKCLARNSPHTPGAKWSLGIPEQVVSIDDSPDCTVCEPDVASTELDEDSDEEVSN